MTTVLHQSSALGGHVPIPDALDSVQSLSNTLHISQCVTKSPFQKQILTAKLNKHITHERGLIQGHVGK